MKRRREKATRDLGAAALTSASADSKYTRTLVTGVVVAVVVVVCGSVATSLFRGDFCVCCVFLWQWWFGSYFTRLYTTDAGLRVNLYAG